jgi:PPP family 3-phenylpropionic acid transporter
LAISPLVGMIAQPFWGQLADRTGKRGRLLALLTLATAAGYYAVGVASGFWAIVFATAALALVGTAVLPMTMSVSLALLRDAGQHAFGRVRVWGTIGYFVVVLIFPSLLPMIPTPAEIKLTNVSQPGLGLMFPMTAALVFIASLIAFLLPRSGVVALRAARDDWRELAHNRVFLRFLVFALLAHFLMHGPMWLFPLFVRSRGGDLGTIRNMWILMLLLEIPLVLSTGSGLKRLGARGLLGVGVLVGGLRWFLCAISGDGPLLFAVQALHGVTVVGLNLGSPLYLDVVAPEKLRSTAQSMLSMVAAGIAAIASNASAGWLLDHGGIDLLYFICGAGAIVLGAASWWILPSTPQSTHKTEEVALSSDALA